MRTKNTGSFDKSTKTWRIKGQKIAQSIRQLSKRYEVEIAATELASVKYWRRYLQDLEDGHQVEQKSLSPLQNRIKSLEGIISHLRGQNRPTSDLEGHLRAAIQTTTKQDGSEYEEADIPWVHPDIAETVGLLGLDTDMLAIMAMNESIMLPAAAAVAVPITDTQDTIQSEASLFIEAYKRRGHRGHYQASQAVDLFLSQCPANLPLKSVTALHWRPFVEAVKASPSWGKRTQANMRNLVFEFLSAVETERTEHNLNYGFIYSKKTRLKIPKGAKQQYSLEQVQIALKHATGDVRMSLLLGLNCGMYWGDIQNLKADMIQGEHVTCGRAKLAYHEDHLVGSWLLWPETKSLLKCGTSRHRLTRLYAEFRKLHNLPVHKALRKTTTQVMQDHVGEDAARLFRCEGSSGGHGASYVVPFTPTQIKTLDNALRVVGKLYGLLD